MIVFKNIGFVALCCWCSSALGGSFKEAQQIVNRYCLDCHHGVESEGGFDLERFRSAEDAAKERAVWKRVFDVVESRQMPLKDSGFVLEEHDRSALLDFVRELQKQPDPQLGAIDPGKPVLRRLTRLEYNNTVRDLFAINYDLFMFPERLPIADKEYFLTSGNSLGPWIKTSAREYGQKIDVLLPQIGLPGDNRAEYGFANRGDALNVSPLLIEKYLEVAAAIASNERLLRDSSIMQELLGVTPQPIRPLKSDRIGENSVAAAKLYAPNDNLPKQAEGNDTWKAAFVSELTESFERGSGGVFDVPKDLNNKTIAGKGGLIKVKIGMSTLTINPNVDLWLASFATAEETSGELLLTNRVKDEKSFELTFKVDGEEGRRIEHLGVCVLARRNQTGEVTLRAMLTTGQHLTRSAMIGESGNTFFSFVAPSGASIKSLQVDGSRFSGPYVLLDDFGFILNPIEGASPNREVDLHTTDVLPIEKQLDLEPISAKPREVKPIRERVKLFLTRAYRRAVSETEIQSALQIVDENSDRLAEDGSMHSSDRGLRRLIQSTLSSPDFLFLAEPVRGTDASVRKLTGFELAARMSYFLWSSMPDEELLRIAESGNLNQPETLVNQTTRMLSDRRRCRELSESFAVQWLRLDQLYASKPDRELFKPFYSGPQGKATLHAQMLTEALLLFETVLVEDRSVIDLIDANYTWLSPQLAKHYDMETVYTYQLDSLKEQRPLPSEADTKGAGQVWVRCPLPDRNRGGVITMAGPLTLTSLPFRTSPIKRGAWLLETIFNRPPAEPKVAFVLDDVPAEKESQPTSLSVRQRFENHRKDPNCYSCHSRIDPPGFSLENFDAIGVWRSHEGTQRVDASGEWNGIRFESPSEFKIALRVREQEFVRGFTEHLMSYALGRPLEYFDMPAIDTIVQEAAKQDYRMSSILTGVITSYPFRHVRNTP